MDVHKLGEKSLHLQSAMIPNIVGKQLWFLYAALFCNVIYGCVKFEVTSFSTLEVIPRTKTDSKNIQRAKT